MLMCSSASPGAARLSRSLSVNVRQGSIMISNVLATTAWLLDQAATMLHWKQGRLERRQTRACQTSSSVLPANTAKTSLERHRKVHHSSQTCYDCKSTPSTRLHVLRKYGQIPDLPAQLGRFRSTTEWPAEFQQRCQRIMPTKDGNFLPTEGGSIVADITNEMLVVATQAVCDVCEQDDFHKLSNPQKRALAWILADAMGTFVPINAKAALIAGQRLHRQASRVREKTDAAVAAAVSQRAEAKAAADGHAALTAALPAALAAIDEAEQMAFSHPHTEIYVSISDLGLPKEVEVEVEVVAQGRRCSTTGGAG